jgi:hypothetical protein
LAPPDIFSVELKHHHYDKNILLSLPKMHKLCQQDVENIKLNNSNGWRNQKKKTISNEHSILEKLRDGFS